MTSLYITSVNTFSGKTAIALGLGLRMQAAGLKVGYLKPVSTQPYKAGGRVLDEDADFVRRTLGLETPPWELSPVIVTNELLEEVMDGTMVRILTWYDNEWGFSNRMSDTAVAFGKLI